MVLSPQGVQKATPSQDRNASVVRARIENLLAKLEGLESFGEPDKHT